MDFGLVEKKETASIGKAYIDEAALETKEGPSKDIHPLYDTLKAVQKDGFNKKIEMAERAYGGHMSYRLRKENELLSTPLGHPGMPQHRQIGHEILHGDDTSIGFKDMLTNDEDTELAFDMHKKMDQYLESHRSLDRV